MTFKTLPKTHHSRPSLNFKSTIYGVCVASDTADELNNIHTEGRSRHQQNYHFFLFPEDLRDFFFLVLVGVEPNPFDDLV